MRGVKECWYLLYHTFISNFVSLYNEMYFRRDGVMIIWMYTSTHSFATIDWSRYHTTCCPPLMCSSAPLTCQGRSSAAMQTTMGERSYVAALFRYQEVYCVGHLEHLNTTIEASPHKTPCAPSPIGALAQSLQPSPLFPAIRYLDSPR